MQLRRHFTAQLFGFAAALLLCRIAVSQMRVWARLMVEAAA